MFILGGGSSFFQCREFAVLHFFGKKIIYIVHGTDIRPAYIDGIREEEEPITNAPYVLEVDGVRAGEGKTERRGEMACARRAARRVARCFGRGPF